MITPQQFQRLPTVMQDIVTIDHELQEIAAQDVIVLNQDARSRFARLRGERAEKKRYAEAIWGHRASGKGPAAHV